MQSKIEKRFIKTVQPKVLAIPAIDNLYSNSIRLGRNDSCLGVHEVFVFEQSNPAFRMSSGERYVEHNYFLEYKKWKIDVGGTSVVVINKTNNEHIDGLQKDTILEEVLSHLDN